jgi:hypothetical protein
MQRVMGRSSDVLLSCTISTTIHKIPNLTIALDLSVCHAYEETATQSFLGIIVEKNRDDRT